VLLVAERRRRLSRAEAGRFVELLGALPIVVEEVPFELATSDVLSRAREHGLSAYDAAYLDLAMRKGLPLATRDSTLRAACRKAGVSMMR
jgi:predicted nucleic acid-binding protein